MKRLLPVLIAMLLALPAAARQTAPEPAAEPAYEPVKNPELYREALRHVNQGQPEEAVPLLRRFLVDEPNHAGAWLELAMSECELGNGDEAERLFKLIEVRFDPPPGILEVIATRRGEGCKRELTKAASWLLSVSRGRNDNVNQGARDGSGSIGTGSNQTDFELDPEFLPKRDSYTQATGSYLLPLNSKGSMAILQGYALKHDHVTEQDVSSVLAGLEHAWAFDGWRARGTIAYGATTLGGALYQRQHQAQLRVAPPLPLPKAWDFALAANLNHVEYPTRDSYDGNTWELSTITTYRTSAHQVQLTLSGLRDHGAASRPGGSRKGWFGNLQWYTSLGSGWFAEAGLSHQLWRSDQIYSPELIDIVRRQNTTIARGAVQYYFRPNYSIYLEGRATRNRENIALFQYNAHSVQLGLRWDNF